MSTDAEPEAREVDGGSIGVAPHPDDEYRVPENLLPPEPVFILGRRVARRRERRRRRAFVLIVAGVMALVATVVVVLPKGGHAPAPKPPLAFGPAPPSVAWALTWQNGALGSSLAVIGVPTGDPAFAVVAPDDASVDLPSGAPLTVGPASSTGPAAVEAAQALMNRRVGHYLFSTPADIAALVNRMGGLTFNAQGSAIVNGVPIGPGQTHATGAQIESYLSSGTGVDRWVRWEDVVSGLLDSKADAAAWSRVPGRADAGHVVTGLLTAAHGATVVDLPTATVFGTLKVDPKGVDAMIAASFKDSLGGLVRVVVQNGNGLPGMGQQVGALLAPYGYRVVESQNASSFDEPVTKILASGRSYMRWAQEAQGVLGAGSVYLDPQPTGVADVVIIVGKDFGTG
jgi:hypothetical protein